MTEMEFDPVGDDRCYGVAIHTFDARPINQPVYSFVLSLELGEQVIIKSETTDWYYVKKYEGDCEGIVPKAYVKILKAKVIRDAETEIVIPESSPLIRELDSTLKEWNRIAKKLFISTEKLGKDGGNFGSGGGAAQENQNDQFLILEQLFRELYECRKKVLTTSPTVEDLKDLRKQAARIIDTGNNMFKLDMVVRDENGNPLDARTTSTIELFRQYQKSSHQLRKKHGANRRSRIFVHNNHSLVVALESISWRITEHCEVRCFLFDGEKEVPITESVLLEFAAGDPPGLPITMIFTDIGKTIDFVRTKVYFVAYVVRVGAMDYKEPDSKKDINSTPFSTKGASTIQVRRPFGVAAKDITHLFRENFSAHNDKEALPVYYLPNISEETMDTTLLKLITSIKASDPCHSSKDPRAVGLYVTFTMASGNSQHVMREQPNLLKGSKIITARKMGFPEVIYPNDVRNDLYINMTRGEFHRSTTSRSDKNIEVTVSVHTDNGRMLTHVISGGTGQTKKDPYKSVVYYHEDKPKWNEYLKVSLPMNIEDFTGAHIRFTFKHRSSTDSKDRSERPFALAYIRLKDTTVAADSGDTAIKDGLHDLYVYKVDPKHFKETEVQYLNLPSERTASWQVTSKPNCPQGFSYSPKDCFFIKTTLCSTKFTQDSKLLNLLQWVTQLKDKAERMTKEKAANKEIPIIPALLQHLNKVLLEVREVNGEEIVKFLTDVFDALFSILVDPVDSVITELESNGRGSVIGNILTPEEQQRYKLRLLEPEACDESVFECLIYIFGLILDHKYQNFQSVLAIYIEDGFFSTLAYKKLSRALEKAISKPCSAEKLLKIMKSIEFFFKFIVKSYENHQRVLLMEVGEEERINDTEFISLIDNVFGSMGRLLKISNQDPYILAQGGCLKHLPGVIPDLIKVYPNGRLSGFLVEIGLAIPQGRLVKQKLQFITDIVHSELFMEPECRQTFLPILIQTILHHLPGNEEEMRRKSVETKKVGSQNKAAKLLGATASDLGDKFLPHSQVNESSSHVEETEKCVELLGDVMDIFYKQPDTKEKRNNICYVMQVLLRPITSSIGVVKNSDPMAGSVLAIFLSLLRELNNYGPEVLAQIVNDMKNKKESVYSGESSNHKLLLTFLNDMLVVLKNLFNQPIFPTDWREMILLQNSIVVGALEHLAGTVKTEFIETFEENPWNNFFHCGVSFLTQESLQLEEFSQSKRYAIIEYYGDMRKAAAELIKHMWFSLGESKRNRFVPMMVGPFLDMAFVPEPRLRRNTIPIFFDMMHCEFDQDKPKKSFEQVEEELIRKIVEGFEGGKGDSQFRDIFFITMNELCENNKTGLSNSGIIMVSTLTKLMDRLLQYREVMYEEDCSNRMSCIMKLLKFSQKIDRKDLYLRYLYKLHDLHIHYGNYTEGAYTLKLHSRNLEWIEEEIPLTLRSPKPRHQTFITQSELKEALYHEIIELFSKAQMYECALEVCDELRQQYADEMFNYSQLSPLLQKMATFYDKILSEPRFDPHYFRVGFYGSDFPSFLRNKLFIYRGGPYESLSDFETRMMQRFPRAELMQKLEAPPPEIAFMNRQCLQICLVEPLISSSKRMSGMKYADQNIRKYYECHEVDKFVFHRAFHPVPKDPENECATLWMDKHNIWTKQSFPGIMSWFRVDRETVTKLPPIVNAIEKIKKTSDDLKKLALTYAGVAKGANINPLTMTLSGVVDAPVNGGMKMYETAFLTPEFLEKNPGEIGNVEELKQLLASLIPVLREAIGVHEAKVAKDLLLLHQHLQAKFEELRARLENYGYGGTDDDFRRQITRARKRQESVSRGGMSYASSKESTKTSDHHSSHSSRVSLAALGRTVGSFSSTTSLYQNHPKYKPNQKSFGYFKRASQSSFSGSLEEQPLIPTPSPGCSTLPRNGFFPSLKPLDAANEKSSQESLIPLTQTLVQQRPPRVNSEARKSQSWTAQSTPSENRASVLSNSSINFHSAPSYTSPSEPGSRTSVNSPDSAIDADVSISSDDTAPPLPPKLRDKFGGESKAPAPTPPPKPPLKVFRDVV